MGCLNVHNKHLKVNKGEGSSISSSTSTFPSLGKMEGGGRGVTSKQIKKIISMAHGTMTEDGGKESSKQKADNGIKCAA